MQNNGQNGSDIEKTLSPHWIDTHIQRTKPETDNSIEQTQPAMLIIYITC